MSQFYGNNFVRIKRHIIVSANLANYAALNNSYVFNLLSIFKRDGNDLITHSSFRLGY